MSQPALHTVVMVPTYNEAADIGDLLSRLLSLSDSLGVVVVDDDSPDGTAGVVEGLAARHRGRIVLHRRPGRLGRASAGIEGLRLAVSLGPRYVVEMDADLSHDPAHIPTFWREIDDCDVVVGSRFVDGGRDAERTLFRKGVSWLSSRLFRLILGLPTRDIGSGYKLYRREVLESLPWPEFLSRGIAISMEELFHIVKRGQRVKEVPIVFRDRRHGSSKLRPADFLEPLQVAVRLAWRHGRAPAKAAARTARRCGPAGRGPAHESRSDEDQRTRAGRTRTRA